MISTLLLLMIVGYIQYSKGGALIELSTTDVSRQIDILNVHVLNDRIQKKFSFDFRTDKNLKFVKNIRVQNIRKTTLYLGVYTNDGERNFDQLHINTATKKKSAWTVCHGEKLHQICFRLHMTVSCANNYFGPLCENYCALNQFEIGNFFCDENGIKMCIPSRTGHGCRQRVFINKALAQTFLTSQRRRVKRKNSIFRTEERLPGNLQRECIEETCSWEEAFEALENVELTHEFFRRKNDINDCLAHPCNLTNTQKCEDLYKDFECICRDGFTGERCSIKVNTNRCENGGTCLASSVLGEPCSCVCADGFTGAQCERIVLRNKCSPNPCQHFGQCIDGIDKYRCECLPGYGGINCEVSDGQVMEPQEMTEQSSRNTFSRLRFQQEDAAILRFASAPIRSDEAESVAALYRTKDCRMAQCRNSGSCQLNNLTSEYRCICPSPFSGDFCDQMDADANNDDGVDISHNNFTDACKNRTDNCQNNGTCYTYEENKIACLCTTGFIGNYCEFAIDFCEGYPLPNLAEKLCGKNGRCVNSPTGYSCRCNRGFAGPNCNEDISDDPCKMNPKANFTWMNGCNKCWCKLGVGYCSNQWCGPSSCKISQDCSSEEVCQVSGKSSCLVQPCDTTETCQSRLMTQCSTSMQHSVLDCVVRRGILDVSKEPKGTDLETCCREFRKLPLMFEYSLESSLSLRCEAGSFRSTDEPRTVEIYLTMESNRGTTNAFYAMEKLAEHLRENNTNACSNLIFATSTASNDAPKTAGSSNAWIIAITTLVCLTIIVLIVVFALYIKHKARKRTAVMVRHREFSRRSRCGNDLQDYNRKSYISLGEGSHHGALVNPAHGDKDSGHSTCEDNQEETAMTTKPEIPILQKVELRRALSRVSYVDELMDRIHSQEPEDIQLPLETTKPAEKAPISMIDQI